MAGVDHAVGEVLDYLRDNGLEENTIVVYTSDQGFYLGEHGWFDKRWMYEPSFRMPLLIKYPKKIKAGSHNENLVLNIDFAPTLLDLANLDIPEEIQGESFKNQLFDEAYTPRDAIYYHYYEFPYWHKVQPHYGIRTKKYKLIHYYYSMDEWELFDLENDKNEMNNLYGDPDYQQVVTALRTNLVKLQIKYKDNMTLEEMKAMTDIKIQRVYQENSRK